MGVPVLRRRPSSDAPIARPGGVEPQFTPPSLARTPRPTLSPLLCQLRIRGGAERRLEGEQPVPDEPTLAAVLRATAPAVTAPSQSLVEPYRDRVIAWRQAGIQGTTIHQTLVRQYGFSGSYVSVARFLQSLSVTAPTATVRLEFAPGDAVQVDFGRGPMLLD